jgi:hypothetical protein
MGVLFALSFTYRKNGSMVKYEDVQVGDVIKYQFAFENEDNVTGVAISEVMDMTSKVCLLEYTDYSGGIVGIPFTAILEVYRKVK